MKRQSKSWWCGVAAIANALEVLGIRRSQREISRSCAVTEADGTDETEMKRALLANGVGVDELMDCEDPIPGFWWVYDHVKERGPVILCVDDDEHWVTVIGECAGRLIVFDPSRNSGNEVHDLDSLTARWVNAEGQYYGIGVSK